MNPNKYRQTLIIILTLIFLGFSLYTHFIAGNSSSDKEIILYHANKLYDGAILYKDMFVVNLPAIYYIYQIPIFLSRHIDLLEDYHFLALIGFAGVTFVIFISWQLIRVHEEFHRHTQKQIQFCLLLAAVFIVFQHPFYFFDREHIFYVFTFPYLLRFMPSLTQKVFPVLLRVMIGGLAAIGLIIKPYCLVLPAAIGLFYCLRERSANIIFTVENRVIYLFLLAYISFIYVFTPEYFAIVMPMAMALYSAAGYKINGLGYFSLILLSFGIAVADFRVRYRSPYRQDIYYLLMLCIAFLLYALLNQGWGYCYNVLASHVMILTGFLLWEYNYLAEEYKRKGLEYKNFIFGKRACIINFTAHLLWAAVIIVATPSFLPQYRFEDRSSQMLLQQSIAANDAIPLKSFGTISLDFDTWPYMARKIHAKWVTRFAHLWMLHKFIADDNAFIQYSGILKYVADALAEDLHKGKPDIVYVDTIEHYYPTIDKNVNLIDYFTAFPEFMEEWKHYRYVTTIGTLSNPAGDCPAAPKRCDHFMLYKRIDRTDELHP